MCCAIRTGIGRVRIKMPPKPMSAEEFAAAMTELVKFAK
jgi:hypothetical protein